MSKKNKKHSEQDNEQQQMLDNEQVNAQTDENVEVAVDDETQPDNDETGPQPDVEVDNEPTVEEQLEQQKKEYLFLMADFDNFRKRTLQEKQDLIKNGAAKAMEQLLPVVDDFERALDAIDKGGDIESLKEGVNLIYNKFIKYLKQQNVEAINSTGELFDTDLHEAVTTFPAPSDDLKGKVIDTVLKGYMINDKVLRHAKVVVGQ